MVMSTALRLVCLALLAERHTGAGANHNALDIEYALANSTAQHNIGLDMLHAGDAVGALKHMGSAVAVLDAAAARLVGGSKVESDGDGDGDSELDGEGAKAALRRAAAAA